MRQEQDAGVVADAFVEPQPEQERQQFGGIGGDAQAEQSAHRATHGGVALAPGVHDANEQGLHDHRDHGQEDVEDAGVIAALQTVEGMAQHLIETGQLDAGVDDDAPGIQGIGRFRSQSAGCGDDDRHLYRAGECLPPDEHLAVFDAALGVMDAVLRQEFDVRLARAHVEELPGQGEELRHPAPDAERLCRWQDVNRQDDVLIDDERDEEYQSHHEGDQEPGERTVEADLLPLGRGFADLELAAVCDDFVQLLGVLQAVAPDKHEGHGSGCHQQGHDQEQDIAGGRMRHRRSRVIGESHRRLTGGARDHVIDQVIVVGPFLDLRIGFIRQESVEEIDLSAAR